MTESPVLIAGGGIGGLATALTLHQIGVPCVVFEAAREMRPLGVGINMQPNAVRELYDLGITEGELDQVGLPAREWALVGLNGNDIYSEPRGRFAGYNWPQYAVHRGRFHMLLHEKVAQRLGPQAIRLGCRVTGYRNNSGSVTAHIAHADGSTSEASGALLIGADGIHSAVRAQMHPEQPPIHWGGAIMWRGTTWGKPIRSGSSFVGLGTHRQRVVFYPISHPDPASGLSMINWIAEVTLDNHAGWKQSGWFRPVSIDEFQHHFAEWIWDWLDVPALIRQADIVFENPMIDRDPVPTWQDGPVVLLGDAAHPMTPNLGQGAGQAIEDAAVLDRCLATTDTIDAALRRYETLRVTRANSIVRGSRTLGAVGQLQHPIAVWMRNTVLRLTPASVGLNQARKLMRFSP
jgi:2-polyprenyl-6-methoxyphenol hydroxylase-like FAD-dependent oxidoreductase